ncbi:NADPH:quinone oxidoreductase family protein [Nocardia sp. NPDC057663]|uniref:NADPH:quinone oxidoreductase family protein n=1 Tax=Nocardia sp. NPDC057663 TaxID=3346201 RepID=UPI00366E7F62
MAAVQLTDLRGPAALRTTRIPVPDSRDKVLIEVRAAGVNFPDLLMTYGKYQMRVPAPFVPGFEVSGVVSSAPEASGMQVGDEVVAFCSQLGGYAEFVAVDPVAVAIKPPELEFGAAAALLSNFQTVHFALTRRASLRVGQKLLVLGAAGGIGTAAVQVGKALGAEVIAVARREGVAEQLIALGADHVVPLTDGWAARVRELTGGTGVDHVLDPIGGPAFDEAVRVLAPEGTLLVVGFAAGGQIPSVKVNRLLLRNVSVAGVAWGEYMRVHPGAFAESMTELGGLVAQGLRPFVSARFPLADAAEALTALERGQIVGKAVMEQTASAW